MQLVILGMHRSGTSGVTRLLNLAGAWFGPDGIATEANEENPRGFWERRDVREVCDGLLHSGGHDWWKLADFDLAALPAEGRDRWTARFGEILEGELDHHRPWVVKEPRLCLLFPVLRPLLDAPVCVHVTREPLEVAQSVHRRNGFSRQAALALWELHTVAAFAASEGLPRVLVRYEDLMADPVATTARLLTDLEALGVTGLHPVPDDEVHAFISADLHRQHQDPSARHGRLNLDQAALAAAIDDGSILHPGQARGLSAAARDQLVDLETTVAAEERIEQVEAQLAQVTRHAEWEAAARREVVAATLDALAAVDAQLEAADRSHLGRLARRAVAARQQVTPGVARTGEGLVDGARAVLSGRRADLDRLRVRHEAGPAPDPDDR